MELKLIYTYLLTSKFCFSYIHDFGMKTKTEGKNYATLLIETKPVNKTWPSEYFYLAKSFHKIYFSDRNILRDNNFKHSRHLPAQS